MMAFSQCQKPWTPKENLESDVMADAIPLVGFCCQHVFAGGRREQSFHVNARLGDGSLSAMPIKP